MIGRETWLAFAIGGPIGHVAGFAHAALSARDPQGGGTVVLFTLGLTRRLAGGLSLLYLAIAGISTSSAHR